MGWNSNRSADNKSKIEKLKMMKIENVDKCSSAETTADSNSTAELLPSASLLPNPMLGAVKRKVSFTVPHCEDWKPVVAQGFIEGDYFTGEYRSKGMTYGVTIKVSFKSFLAEKPKDKAPLIVRFMDGSIDHAYYVGYTNTVYPRSLYRHNTAKEWCYR